jgi:radical SAM superfamily enzyme YgiQ (UPF0313 family)
MEKSMKILFIYTNTNRFLSPAPAGIAYLIPQLKRRGHQIKLVDLMYSENPMEDIDKEINDFKPDAAGLSIRNLDNHNMMSPDNPMLKIREYIGLIKRKGIKTILGGPAFTTLPEEMLKYLKADYGIAGQGEESLPQLIDMIKKNTLNRSIPGFVWKENGKIYSNPEDKSGYNRKHPDWSLINTKSYKKNMFPAMVIIKTGCEFNCLYCNTCLRSGYSVIPRDIDSIIKDIKEIIKIQNTSMIYFSDPCLTNPIDFAKDLFKAIIDEKLKISISSNLEPAKGCYDEELFELYKRAGGLFTILGCESFSPAMLKTYKKPFNMDDVIKWSDLAKKTGLKFIVQLLLGGPGENESTIKETLEALPSINFSLFLYNIGIRIYPNTGLFEIAKKEGILKSKEELLFPKFYVSKELDVEWARKYISRTTRKYSLRMAGMLPVMGRMLLKKYI